MSAQCHSTGPCARNAKNNANGCCRSVSTCCKEKTDFQQAIQTYTDEINAYRLKKRLLSDKFKKRPSSKCDDFKTMSKSAYETECQKIQAKIDARLKNIKNLKTAKKASMIVRDPDANCNCN